MWIKAGMVESGDAVVSSLCNHMAEKAGLAGSFQDNGGEPLYDNILRQSPPTLFSAALRDRFKLLSPRLWKGIIDFEDKKADSKFGISVTFQSVLGLLLPLGILWAIDFGRLTMIRQRHSAATAAASEPFQIPRVVSKGFILSLIISPWTLRCLFDLYHQSSILLKSLKSILKNRSSTLKRAIDALKLRIQCRRAYRTQTYDTYLPTKILGDGEDSIERYANDRALRALLLIPGASVAHEAYSEVAARLSDEGFLVVVISLEPLRLAQRYAGANIASVKRIITEVTSIIHHHVKVEYLNAFGATREGVLPLKTIEWTLIGHSMGSFAAMQIFDEFFGDPNGKSINSRVADTERQQKKCTNATNILIGNRMVLWGVAAFVDYATDLSDRKDAKILIIQGTNDEFVELMQSRQADLEACFPAGTRTVHIAGGTHEGFSSYEPCFRLKGNETENMTSRSIPLDQQHQRACEATVRFLRL